MDDQWSFRIGVKVHSLFKNFGENMKFLFFKEVQITRLWNHLRETSLVSSVKTSLRKQIECFVLVDSYPECK